MKHFFDTSPDAILIHRDSIVIYVNPAAQDLLGYDPAELIGSNVTRVIVPHLRAAVLAHHSRVLAEGIQIPLHEGRMLCADGSVTLIDVQAHQIQWAGIPAVLTCARDIGDRKRAAAWREHLNRMMTIEMLAGGVGHDINNPLAYVLSNLDFALGELRERSARAPRAPEDHAQLIDIIDALQDAQDGAERIRGVVEEFHAVSRLEVVCQSSVQLGPVIDATVRMLCGQLGNRIALVRSEDPSMQLKIGASKLAQVLINLLRNAIQSFPSPPPADAQIRIRSDLVGDDAVIEIEDTGRGIPADIRARIFEPFFSTKQKSSGLGLSLSHEIVTAHSGTLTVRDRHPHGSVFQITLPHIKHPTKKQGM